MFKMVRVVATIIFINFFLVVSVNASDIDVSGYVTLFAGYTNQKDDIYGDFVADNYIDFTDKSHAGLQFNSEINKNLDFSLTVLMEGRDEFMAFADWFYATYTASKNTSYRFGRLKVPFFMVSNYIDIGHAYPWVAPPLEVYNVKLVKSVDGFEFIYQTELFNSIYSFDVFMGTGKNKQSLSPSFINDGTVNAATPAYKTGDKINFKSHNLIGFETSLAGDNVTLRIGHYTNTVDADEFNIVRARMAFSSAGIIVNWSNFLLYSEYVTRESDSSVQHLFSDQVSRYITIGYKISDFIPYITLASIEKGKDKNKYGLMQESSSMGLRYDINPKMDVKFEISKITPKADDGDVGRTGFFDKSIEGDRQPLVLTMSFDLLF